MKRCLFLFAVFALTLLPQTVEAADKLRLMIIDGQNNHNWRATTPILQEFLTRSGRFEVSVVTTPTEKSPATDWSAFQPKFSEFQVVLSNYNGEMWPESVQKGLEKFVSDGGGLVIVHAANNAFSGWSEYNTMIGLGWRGADFGDRVTTNDAGETIRTEKGKGPGAGHGSQHEFAIRLRDTAHPVVKGMPTEWLHAKDELYHGQRGPAVNMHLIATAFADQSKGGTGAHEPMIWWIPYGKGKVFTTVMGHADYSMKCVGFQSVVSRGSEWSATGEVTLPIPENFPKADKVSSAP
ncbi:MAG: ThuA domain-containing protein [Planctomycetia bacterium]|nr:ThuA domain-containing protein [Planctomycetia bacterium]